MSKMSGASHNLALLTDLYELTMAASYFEHKQHSLAAFDLFIRGLPKNRSFFVAAGLSDAINFLKTFRFDSTSLAYLKSLGLFSNDFLDFLKTVRFRGTVWALPEGTVFFPNEPVMRVVAPIIEAQLLESYLLNTINVQTMIATKAARIVHVAQGKGVFDFSLRRTHGSDAANKVARSAYLAGFDGTANVLAGKQYGIPVVGTMAHSFVMAFDNEKSSFRAFAQTFPDNATLLVDTYGPIQGIKNAIVIAHELEKKKKRLRGIRLDSGNFVYLSRRARTLLDAANLSYVKIFASGNLDEYKINDLVKQKAPVDSFGVGTKMGVSADAPYCDVIYKLSEITDVKGRFLPTMKLSKGKVTYPGRKQIYRSIDKKGVYKRDVLGLEGEQCAGHPLLIKVVDNGVVIYKSPLLSVIRERTKENLASIPPSTIRLQRPRMYPVEISPALKKLTQRISKDIIKKTRTTSL